MNHFSQNMERLLALGEEIPKFDRAALAHHAVANKEVFVSRNGALVQWSEPESTGRSPQDTYIVVHEESKAEVDWSSANNNPIPLELAEALFAEAVSKLETANHRYMTRRAVGADSHYALPVYTYSDSAISALFSLNMFREIPHDLSNSIFHQKPFHLVVLPKHPLAEELQPLRKDGRRSQLALLMDFDRHIGLVIGSSYLGSIKKLLFTVMNYLLPAHGVLPLHASANEGRSGDIALFLGLSGTGKTTLSADPERALLGDDEHGWSDQGIANFENGCYAKLIHLDPEKEPEIYRAITHEAPFETQGAIVENAMLYPDGHFDFNDIRLTENSRGSYPLTALSHIKPSSVGAAPQTIIFLTADANGVLPPVAKLTRDQAMLWFLMGYTSKLAGTETGIKEPVSTFSRFFGSPFMPRLPNVYTQMLGEKLAKHMTQVYLINTGWSGGPYGEGARISLPITRQIIKKVLDGTAAYLEYAEDKRFHVMVPLSFPGVEERILRPENTWKDQTAYAQRADRLAREFRNHFDKAYGAHRLPSEIVACCPGT